MAAGNRIDRNLFFLSCGRIQSCHKIGDSRLFKDDLDIPVILFRTLEWKQLITRLSGISVNNLLCDCNLSGGEHPFYFRYSAILSNNISSAGSHFTDLNVS